MELRICCDAAVKLLKMTDVVDVECNIDSYTVKGDTLEGNILIRGNYVKDNLEEKFAFSEFVPFTIVFKDRNYLVNHISVQEFECQEIINQGIECKFNIVVDYTPQEVEVPVETGEAVPVQEFPEAGAEIIEEKQQEVMDAVEVETMNDEEIKAEINKKYDDLLNEILEAREDENFYEPEKAITINSDSSREDCRGLLASIQEHQASYRVYYTNKETDIEQICKAERLSLDRVYRDNQKTDFLSKKRIIIK